MNTSVAFQYTFSPAFGNTRPRQVALKCRASSDYEVSTGQLTAGRRAVLGGASLAALGLLLPEQSWAAGKPSAANVGSYLPKGEQGFVNFRPNDAQTPSIRAGVIDSADAYKFVIPESWSEQKIANIQSGNFCMPRCDEPWQEVVFADNTEGKVNLTVLNLRKLTNKQGATIDKIGSPTGIIQSIGPYITGTVLDEEEVTSADKVQKGNQTYYSYEALSLSGTSGPHYLAVATAKKDLVYLFIISATEAQWKKSKGKLKKMAQSFEV